MAQVTLKGIRKIYPNSEPKKKKPKKGEEQPKKTNLKITSEGVIAVDNFNLDIADKEFIVLVGPSGCGKSTTLRMIAGLEDISDGELLIDGRVVNDVGPKDRNIAMVFQSYALYPHLTVYDNMAFPLKQAKLPKAEIDKKVREAAEILDITQFLERKPKALSGGQRQRVAIGRAIVRNPSVLLMDEPLSNLDAKLRNQMRAEIIKLRSRIDTTFIYVTHDQTEAMTLGDRIVIMKDGEVQQIGTPSQLFHDPINIFVATFIGMPAMNLFDAMLTKTDDGYNVTVDGFTIPVSQAKAAKLAANNVGSQEIIMGIRPEHIELTDGEGIKGKLDVFELMGSSAHLHITAVGQDTVAIVPVNNEDQQFTPDMDIKITFAGRDIQIFDKETEKNLAY